MNSLHPLRASGASLAAQCHAAPYRSLAMPEIEAGSAADEGTMLHGAVERAYRHNDYFGLDPDQCLIVASCVDLLKREAAGSISVEFEVELPVMDAEGLPIMDRPGHADVVIFFMDRITVIDWKTGRVMPDYPASGDWQGATYCVGVFNGFEMPLESVEFVRFHPRFGREAVTRCTYQAADFHSLETDLKALVASIVPDAAATPGQWCCECNARLSCHECAAWVGDRSIALVPAVSESMPLESLAPALERMMEFKRIVDRAIEDGKQLVRRALEQGQDVPGFSLKPGNKMRSIEDIAAAREALAAVPSFAFDSHIKVSVAGLETEFKAWSGLKGKAAREEWERLMGPLIAVKQGQDKLVMATAKMIEED